MKLKKVFSVLLIIIIAFSAVGALAAEESIVIKKVSGYDTFTPNPDGGVMEIVAYNEKNGFAYAVNGQSGMLSVIPLEGESYLTAEDFDVQSQVTADDFTYGDMTSVAVSPNGELLAVAVQAEDYSAAGKVLIFDCNADGSLEYKAAVNVGVQPDMVVFFDDNTILTADEGEPREGYGEGGVDPKGSVSVVDAQTYSSSVVDFTEFDLMREEMVCDGIVLKKNTLPSVDLEPEYIAISSGKAYITLQEANAVAVMDVGKKTFTGIYSLGFEDYSEVPIDIDKKDEVYNPKTYQSLMGIRMPDAIAAYEVDGVTYIITANEGDSREWGDYINEDERNFGKGKTSPTGLITAENSSLGGKVVFFLTEDYDGLDETKDYLFGGRSFTVYEVTDTGITEVFTSRDDFERITAEKLPEYFNCSNDDKTIDDRSGKKGPEPETVTIGEANGRMYAFIALERVGGIMAYDVTDADNIFYAGYVNSRDFSEDIAGDVAPEGLCYVRYDKNPYGKNILLAACEVSGTVAVYTIEEKEAGLPFKASEDDITVRINSSGVEIHGEFKINSDYVGDDAPAVGDKVTVLVSLLKNGAPLMVSATEVAVDEGKIEIPDSRLYSVEDGEYAVAGISVLSGVSAIEAVTEGNMGTPVAVYKPY